MISIKQCVGVTSVERRLHKKEYCRCLGIGEKGEKWEIGSVKMTIHICRVIVRYSTKMRILSTCVTQIGVRKNEKQVPSIDLPLLRQAEKPSVGPST